MKLFFSSVLIILSAATLSCDNQPNGSSAKTCYIENNRYINTDIKFDITFPQSWVLTLDTTINNKKYDLFGGKPHADSIIFLLQTIKNVAEKNYDSIMNADERSLKASLENYSTLLKTTCAQDNLVCGCFQYSFSANGNIYTDMKVFALKGNDEIIFRFSLISPASSENGIEMRDILTSINFN